MKNKISIDLAHQMFGHADEESTKKTAKALGFDISKGKMKPCESCARAKAKQRNVPKLSNHQPSNEVNGRVFLDLSVIKRPKEMDDISITKGNWCLIVDEATGMKFSSFHETKNGMIEPVCEKFSKWSKAGKPVKVVRCDNAGENVKLEETCNGKNWQLNVKFEYTARDTPHVPRVSRLLLKHSEPHVRFSLSRAAPRRALLLSARRPRNKGEP